MQCCKCNNELKRCVCPDLEGRIADLKKSPYLHIDWDAILKANREFRKNLKKGESQ